MYNAEGKFVLRRAVLNITYRCNLRCKLCVTGGPRYKVAPHYSFNYLAETMHRFFKIVDYVEWYEISGGEPFIHPDLAELIDCAMSFKKQFDKLLIITNGSLLPHLAVISAMQRHAADIIVFISDYGELSSNVKELTELLLSLNIDCKIKSYHGDNQYFGGWVDYGSWERRNDSPTDLAAKFKRCGASKMQGIFTTHAGTMHWCVRSAKGLVVDKLIPEEASDYIDLFDDALSVEQQRSKIVSLFIKPYISVCNYCDGDGDNAQRRYPAAKQLS